MKNLKTTQKSNPLIKKLVPMALSTLLTISISTSFNASAIVVSDPTSYSYYIKQLKQGIEEVRTLKGSLKEAQHLTGAFDGFMNDLRSQFDFTKDIQRNLQGQLSSYNDYQRSLSTTEKKSLDFSRKYDLTDLRDVIDTNLDGIYVDPTNPEYGASQIKKLRTIERQRLLKEGLIKTEEKLALLEQKYKDINKLAAKSRKTTNTKESLDLNNAILLEILAAMHSLIEVTSTLGQAEMAAGFINYSKEAHENKVRIDKLKYANGRRYSKKFATKQDRNDWYDACVAFKLKNGHTDITMNGVDCSQRALRKRFEKQRKKYEKFDNPYGI